MPHAACGTGRGISLGRSRPTEPKSNSPDRQATDEKPHSILRPCDRLGAALFALACKRRLGGIVSKRANAPYRSGRSSDWLKTKCTYRQEFVIGGYRRETTGRPNLGSLLIGYYDGAKLIYAGSVGTGWSVQLGRSIMARLLRIGRDSSPFVAVPRPDARMPTGLSPSSSVRSSSRPGRATAGSGIRASRDSGKTSRRKRSGGRRRNRGDQIRLSRVNRLGATPAPNATGPARPGVRDASHRRPRPHPWRYYPIRVHGAM